jgi:hypothetical protein
MSIRLTYLRKTNRLSPQQANYIFLSIATRSEQTIMSTQLIFEPMRPVTRKSVTRPGACTAFERHVPGRPANVPTLSDPWSPPLGAGDPATEIEGPLPFVALPFSPAGAQFMARSAGAIGGLLLTVLIALGVLNLAATESAPAAHWERALAQPAALRGDAMMTGDFTGQFDHGVPVYRLPVIEVGGIRTQN